MANRRKPALLQLSESDWSRVFQLRCRSKRGEHLSDEENEFCQRACKADEARYSGMNVAVFQATKPFGAM